MWFAVVVVAVVFGPLLLYVLWEAWHRQQFGDFNKLPGPIALPVLGTTWTFSRDRAKIEFRGAYFTETYQRQYGAFKMWMGIFPVVNVGDPELVQRVIGSSKNSSKGSFYSTLYPWLGRGLLTSSGGLWHTRRHLLTPAFHFSILKGSAELMNEQVDIFINQLSKHADTDMAVDVFHSITRCALDIIMETAMGVSLGSQSSETEPEYVAAVYAMTRQLATRARRPWLLIKKIFDMSSAGQHERELLKVLHGFTDKVIKERRQTLDIDEAQPKRRQAFLDLILTATLPDGSKLSDQDIREEVDTFMFEGHDTTSAAAAWALFLVATHPEVQQKIHEELDREIIEGEPITPEIVGRLKYLELVTKEALRLKPSVPIIIRELSEPLQLNDLTIPAGIMAVIRIWDMHRDPKLWDEPMKFDPDRWLPERAKNYHVYQYIPFSAGPRNCIGQKFAQMEEKIIVAKLLKNFRLECDQTYIPAIPDLILRPQPEVPLRLYTRA